jgi:hypothetical protein
MSVFGTNNNLLSTIILITIIGLLIYYLTKSKDYNLYETENISNNMNDQYINNANMNANMNANSMNGMNDLNGLNQMNVMNSDPNNVANLKKKVSFLNKDTIYEFSPNDINSNNSGADITNAYDNPLPQETRINIVDINKNNVKNYNAKDYLPKEINDEWFDTDFSQAKFNIKDDNLINTDRYIIGINTVGQSLKAGSHDIRGIIPNPKFAISPWNNSTYEPDFNIKPLC